MKTLSLVRCSCLACLILLIASASPVYATLTLTLSGSPGSPVINVTFSGTATVGKNSGSIINFGWDFVPTNFNSFPPQITGSDFGDFNFTSGSAQLLNMTRNQSSAITGIWLQDSSNSPMPGWERFGILDATSITYAAGDVYQWSGSATINLAGKGLTFDSLQPGTTGPIYGLNPITTGILEGQLTIVPEPAALSLFLCGAVAFALKRRA